MVRTFVNSDSIHTSDYHEIQTSNYVCEDCKFDCTVEEDLKDHIKKAALL